MLQFVNNVYNSICKHQLIQTEKKLLTAFSGGQDSICLVIILYLLQTQIQYIFDLIWFNHFWQRSSFFTMLHVSRCSYSLSLRITLWLPLTDVFSEQSARDWRHSATQRVYVFYQYDLCVQGHSKSDRIETVFFNLIRGTGMPGISSLHRTNSQACLCNNNSYPMFFQLVKQTHWITVSTTFFSIYQLVNKSCADIGFAKISPNNYRLIYLAEALHGTSWVSFATSFFKKPKLKGKGKKRIMLSHKLTPVNACSAHANFRKRCKPGGVPTEPQTSHGGLRKGLRFRGNAYGCLYHRLKHYTIAQTPQL